MPENCSEILSLRSVTKNFSGIVAVHDVNMDVMYGERRLIIGTNGAGKSTLFNLICGDFPLSSGSVHLFGKDVTSMSLRKRALMGMRRTYQATALFNKLTVRQNFYLAVLGEKPLKSYLNIFSYYKSTSAFSDKIETYAKSVNLADKLDETVENISHGERRQLELGLALILNPKLLLLDEPSSGLSANERQVILNLLVNLDKDITLLLVEHNMELAFAIATKVTVMMNGEIVCDGTPQEIQNNEYVQTIYLGGK
ncbi:MAG: ATP-binding cassette domain-containing protein [Oscillospiraceae bacterium]